MKCGLKTIAIAIVCCAMIAVSAFGHETDQFTLPAGREFADLGRHLNRWAYDAIEKGVAKVNARGGAADTPAAHEEIVRAVNREFGAAYDVIEGLEKLLHSKAFKDKYPGKVTGYKDQFGNIYEKAHFALDPRQFFRIWHATTFMAYGTYLGTDKIGHFTDMGMHYYRAFTSSRKGGESDEDAYAAAVRIGTHGPIFSERGMVGYLSAGAYGNADLVANFLGLLFYLNLTEDVMIKGQMQPPMLVREGNQWRIAPHVHAESDFYSIFICDHLDEALNPSLYEQGMRKAVREAIESRSEIVLNRRVDRHGNRRTREYFEALNKDARTYYSLDYGHEGTDEELILISDMCFDLLPSVAPATARNAWGLTLLHQAAMNGDMTTVNRMLTEGADPNVQVRSNEDYSPEWGNTPLHYAARDGRQEVAAALLTAGANVSARNDRGTTPLHRGLASPDLIKLLLEKGADANLPDARGLTALHWACEDGQSTSVEHLLLHGASVRSRTNGGLTPTHFAARSGSAPILTKVLAYGGEVNSQSNLGLTPLHFATSRGHTAVVEMLLSHKADVSQKDQFGWVALHEAAAMGWVDIAAALIDKGALPNINDAHRNTPLHMAARSGHTRMIAVLLDRGATIDLTNETGDAPLHEAARIGSGPSVALLLSRGADRNRRNHAGQTATQIASSMRHTSVIALLNEPRQTSQAHPTYQKGAAGIR